MTYIGSRHLRIIPGGSDASASPSDAEPDDFNYAALLKGVRAWRRLARDARTRDMAASDHADDEHGSASVRDDDHPGKPDTPALFSDVDQASEEDSNQDQDADANLSSTRATVGAHIARSATPVLAAVFARQQCMVALLASLARHIGTFCRDPAVAEAGNWDVELPLDPGVLPHTTLYLSLSRFGLQLRFDTQNPTSRQLLLEHSGLLERELDAILRAWGEPRDIELTLW
jgi:type III secretion control protein HpaP